jgi:hypothetical protein
MAEMITVTVHLIRLTVSRLDACRIDGAQLIYLSPRREQLSAPTASLLAWRGFRLKFRGTSSPNVKLKGDFGSQTEVVRLVDRFAF